MEKKDVVMAPKRDTFQKHGIWDLHKQKLILYAYRQPNSIISFSAAKFNNGTDARL
jgi:hypothetical protein